MNDDTGFRRPSARAIACVAIPALALTVGVPFADRLEPLVLGMPFVLAYIVAWILATPLFLTLAYRAEKPRG